MKDWTGNRKSTFVILGASSHSDNERAESDYYATEPKAVEELLKVEKFDSVIWECACGGGHISEVLKQHGYDVFSTDITNRGYKGQNTECDFLKIQTHWHGDIITNPPYKYAKEFVEKALSLIGDGSKVAMLLRIQFLEGAKRGKLLDEYPPKRVYVARKRLTCAKNGDPKIFNASSATCYAWFVWEKGYNGKTTIDYINR